MKKLSLALLASALAAPALAGNIEPAPFEPAPIAPAPVVIAEPVLSFAGAYAGGSLGLGSLSTDGSISDLFGEDDEDDDFDFSLDNDDWAYGVHAGYNFERGSVVFGPELAIFGGEAQTGTGDDDDTAAIDAELNFGTRLALRGGYAFGQNLVYGLLGATYLDMSIDSDGPGGNSSEDVNDWGYAAGFGYERLLTDRVSLGVQYTLNKVDDFDFGGDVSDGNTDVEYRTLELRLNARF